MAAGNKGEAAAFRAYYTEVSAEVRERVFRELSAYEVKGDPDTFERLTVMVLAHTAAGHLLPSQAEACQKLLALISHSIVARKTAGGQLTLTHTVSETIQAQAKLSTAITRKLPKYGNLAEYTKASADVLELSELVPDELEVPERVTVRLSRATTK